MGPIEKIGHAAGYCWRLGATAGCFVVFGIGALILTLVVFPIARVCSPDQDTTTLRVRRAIGWTFRLFVRLMERLGLLQTSVNGDTRLDQGGILVIANHPTLIDVVLLLSATPTCECVVKSALWRNPILGGVMRIADYMKNDSPEGMITECVSRLQRGRSLVIFPEGTRSPPGTTNPFKRGAAHIALQSDCPVVLVQIECDPPALYKGQKWYLLPREKIRIAVNVGKPFNCKEIVGDCRLDTVGVRRLTAYFESRLRTVSKDM